METDVAKDIWKLLLRKKNEHGYQYSSFVNCCEIKVCPKTWAYLTMKSGWFKTSAGTNMGPQNNTYLFAPGYPVMNRSSYL